MVVALQEVGASNVDARAPSGLGDKSNPRVRALQAELDSLRRENARQRAELTAISSSLSQARSMHRDLCAPSAGNVAGLEIHTHYRPAEAIGGDAYEVRRLNDHSIAAVLLDATGHGVSAAILAAYAQQSFRHALRGVAGRDAIQPADVLASVNRDLLEADLPDCQNVAAVVAVYDENERTVRIARAGLPHPILVNANGSRTTPVCGGPLLGAVWDAHFDEAAVKLEAGASLLLHSDGLNEVLADDGDLALVEVSAAPWTSQLAFGEVAASFDQLERRRRQRMSCDDLTAIVLRSNATASTLAVSA